MNVYTYLSTHIYTDRRYMAVPKNQRSFSQTPDSRAQKKGPPIYRGSHVCMCVYIETCVYIYIYGDGIRSLQEVPPRVPRGTWLRRSFGINLQRLKGVNSFLLLSGLKSIPMHAPPNRSVNGWFLVWSIVPEVFKDNADTYASCIIVPQNL